MNSSIHNEGLGDRRRVVAVIPAAGRGRRMERLKQLLPYGQTTMLETVIQTAVACCREGVVAGVVVVVGDGARAAAERHGSDRCRIAVNPDPDSDMLASVRIGWDAGRQAFGLTERDGAMLLPADQPELTGEAIAAVERVFRQANDGSVVVAAAYEGRRGHPAVYSGDLIEATRAWPAGVGLNEVAKRYPERVREVAMGSAIPLDVNTPQAYADVLARQADRT